MHSFYLLEISKPISVWGSEGWQWNTYVNAYFLGSLEEVEKTLSADLSWDRCFALSDEEDITLSVYHEGKEIWKKDVHPYLTFHVPGYPPLKCNDKGVIYSDLIWFFLPSMAENDQETTEPGKYDWANTEKGRQDMFRKKLKDSLQALQKTGGIIDVEVDWGTLEIPKLAGEIARTGEPVAYLDYGWRLVKADYGLNNRWLDGWHGMPW